MFEFVVYVIFGIQLVISTILFFRNRYKVFEIPLFSEINCRQPFWWYVFPFIVSVSLCLAGIVLTGYLYSMILLSLIMFTIFCFHLSLDPLVVKKLSNKNDMRDPSYRRIISYGIRNRIFLLGIFANLALMFYSHINIHIS